MTAKTVQNSILPQWRALDCWVMGPGSHEKLLPSEGMIHWKAHL